MAALVADTLVGTVLTRMGLVFGRERCREGHDHQMAVTSSMTLARMDLGWAGTLLTLAWLLLCEWGRVSH